MPVASNRYFNDPALGQAFNNLAQMFAPPSGSDLAGYATADAKRQEAARLAELFEYAKNPDYNQTTADRMGVLGGLYAPNQSYYSVDQGNAVTMRGQDITAATSRANNAADNQRAAISSLYGALNQGQVRPAVPDDIAALVGLPGIEAASGAPAPLSEAEVKGAILQGMPLADQQAAVIGNIPVEQIVGDDGKTPVFVRRNDAVGEKPFINGGSQAKPTNAVALMPDGRTRVPATQGPDGRWVHAQTGQPLPSDIQIFGLPQATGSAKDIGMMGPTTANETNANQQEAEVTRALNVLDIYEKAVRDNPGSVGLAGLIRGTAQNATATVADLANSFGKDAPQIVAAADEVREGLKNVAPNLFDSTIPEIEFLQGTLAYALARTENPSGEVSRQAYERAVERVKGGGLLANQKGALAAIGANRKVLNTQLDAIRTLRAPGTGRTDTGYKTPPGETDAPVEQFERDPATGRLRRVQ